MSIGINHDGDTASVVKPCKYCGEPAVQTFVWSADKGKWVSYEEPICRMCREVINYETARFRKKVD